MLRSDKTVYSVKFAKEGEKYSIFITNASNEVLFSVENNGTGTNHAGTITDMYAATPDKTLRYSVTLYREGEEIENEELKITIDHTYNLAATNVQAKIKNSTAQTINVKWEAAADAQAYSVTAWINGSIIKMDGTTTETEVDITFSGGDSLEDGDKIEVLVTGYKTVDGKEYSSNSETVEFDWK